VTSMAVHHIEYLIVHGAAAERAFAEARTALEDAGYRLPGADAARRAQALDVWPWPEGGGARLRLPRGFDLGDEVARHLAHGLAAPVLRIFASAGAAWGFDAYAPGGECVCEFRSHRPRRGDEGQRLALWAGQGRARATSITAVLDPARGPDGPEAVLALAAAVGAPYPRQGSEPAALRALLVRAEAAP